MVAFSILSEVREQYNVVNTRIIYRMDGMVHSHAHAALRWDGLRC